MSTGLTKIAAAYFSEPCSRVPSPALRRTRVETEVTAAEVHSVPGEEVGPQGTKYPQVLSLKARFANKPIFFTYRCIA